MIRILTSLFRPAPLVLEDKAAVTRDANRCMAQAGLDGLDPHDAIQTILAWLNAHHLKVSDADALAVYLAANNIHWGRVPT